MDVGYQLASSSSKSRRRGAGRAECFGSSIAWRRSTTSAWSSWPASCASCRASPPSPCSTARARRARRARLIWIAAAGAASGCGIWATHFLAMLAYEPNVPVAYDINLTILSLLAAAIVTGLGIAVAVFFSAVRCAARRRHHRHRRRLHALPRHGGARTARTHRVGAAVRRRIHRDRRRAGDGGARGGATRRTVASGLLLAALLLTLAIVSHHFTAMGAVDIVPDPTRAPDRDVAVADLARARHCQHRGRDTGHEPGQRFRRPPARRQRPPARARVEQHDARRGDVRQHWASPHLQRALSADVRPVAGGREPRRQSRRYRPASRPDRQPATRSAAILQRPRRRAWPPART